MSAGFEVERWRARFPGLAREVAGRPAVFFDGPAGSQVPSSVIEAVAGYLARTNANCGGVFASSEESDALLDGARRSVCDLLGGDDPELCVFGPNMTTLTLALSRALAATWGPGDEVLVTRLEHDANYTPWVLAAERAGARVREVGIRREECTLDMDDLRAKLCARTRLVAVGAASNAVGTLNPVRRVCELAHAVGADVFVDAVHHAPHAAIDVADWGCDYLTCSAYKFFGPHVGVLWGRRELLERLPVPRLRPVPDTVPERWMTGTQNHEGIVGAAAAVEYLAELGRAHDPGAPDRRSALRAAYAAIEAHERALAGRLLDGLAALPEVRVWGITRPDRRARRVPTVSITHGEHGPAELARHLARRGIFVWHGNHYALPLTEALGLEPGGTVRIGMLLSNTIGEVDRLLEALERID